MIIVRVMITTTQTSAPQDASSDSSERDLESVSTSFPSRERPEHSQVAGRDGKDRFSFLFC